MNGLEMTKHRRSVRTFDGAPLTEADRALAQALIREAAQDDPFGLPVEYRLLDKKAHGLSCPVLVGEETYLAGKMLRAPGAEAAFGYSFERILLGLDAAGIGGCIIAGTLDRPAFERAMEKRPDEVVPCVSPLGRPAQKMSLREGLMRKGVKADSRLPFETLFFAGSPEAPLSEADAGELLTPLTMVRLAPSAVNRQPWRVVVDGDAAHFLEKKSRGYVDASGWDMQKIDLGIALCHFVLGLREAGKRTCVAVEGPGFALPADLQYVFTCRWA